MRFLPVLFLLGCNPPPAPVSSGRVIEIYMHPNGLSNCVDVDGDRWKADASCCPEGYEVAGFSVPAVTEYVDEPEKEGGEKSVKRKLYRHVVCSER